jgi:CRP-like cAMP-binding protein
MEKIIEILNQFTSLSKQTKKELINRVTQQEVTKGTILLKQDQTCNQLYFIEKGFARGFYNQDGKEITSWFGFENDIITSIYSFVIQKPGFESIEILENSVLYAISYKNLQELYQHQPEFNLIGRLFIEKYYIELMERTLSLQFRPAKERYCQLVAHKPQLLQRASLGHIASYLGISQETLSRIRSHF